MPLLKRKAIKPVPPPNGEDFDEDTPVYMMRFTNEIFTNYEYVSWLTQRDPCVATCLCSHSTAQRRCCVSPCLHEFVFNTFYLTDLSINNFRRVIGGS